MRRSLHDLHVQSGFSCRNDNLVQASNNKRALLRRIVLKPNHYFLIPSAIPRSTPLVSKTELKGFLVAKKGLKMAIVSPIWGVIVLKIQDDRHWFMQVAPIQSS